MLAHFFRRWPLLSFVPHPLGDWSVRELSDFRDVLELVNLLPPDVHARPGTAFVALAATRIWAKDGPGLRYGL